MVATCTQCDACMQGSAGEAEGGMLQFRSPEGRKPGMGCTLQQERAGELALCKERGRVPRRVALRRLLPPRERCVRVLQVMPEVL